MIAHGPFEHGAGIVEVGVGLAMEAIALRVFEVDAYQARRRAAVLGAEAGGQQIHLADGLRGYDRRQARRSGK